MSRSGVWSLALIFVAVNSCSDRGGIDQLTGPGDRPSLLISDAVRSAGVGGFYFRPPLVPDASPFTGTFDATLAPTARVCRLSTATPRTCTGTVVATFNGTVGPMGLSVDVNEQSYNALWKAPKNLDLGKDIYRLEVYVGTTTLLGYLDFWFVRNSKELQSARSTPDADQYAIVVVGGNVPIKFRIETATVGEVMVSPATPSIGPGSQLFTATVKDLHGNTTSGLTVDWTSSDVAVATVNPASSTTNGSGVATTTATAVGDGTTTITAEAGGVQGTATLTVVLDQPPVAVNDAATVAEDATATTINVLANDTDTDGGPKSITSVTQAGNGTVAITNAGANLAYTPNANYCNNPPGTTLDEFTYTVSPGGSTATVRVTVNCLDDNPVAIADAATVLEDAGASAINVLANDTDLDGGPKSISSVTQPVNGAVVITGGGTGLTYQPNANYCNDPPGTTLDTFTYTLTGGSSTTVTATVTCVDDSAVAVNDAARVNEDAATPTIDVLANDTDAGGVTVASVTQPANGTVAITNAGANLTYTPNANYCNDPPGTTPDTFTYTLSAGGSTATVSVTVTCLDDHPVAVADAATVLEDVGATAINVLANDTDVDGGPKSISSVTQPANGTVVITGLGTGLTYQPNPNYCNDPPGTPLDNFTYTLTGGSSTAVTVTVTCVNDVSVAVDDAATVNEDPSATTINVLANDTDAGGVTVASVTQPTNGTVAITNAGANLTYTPNANYCNSPPGTTLDTFTYTLSSGGSTATVRVTVTCVDDNPVAVADAATVPENAGATAVNVLANDTDVDGGPKLINSVTQPANGSVVITGFGTGLTYQPNPNFCNPPGTTLETFTYTLNGGSSTTVTVTVTCGNDPIP
jgi:VCBS repeat-containing protein